ncbi:MAG TPA: hypothetical protein VFT22_07125 [Kofleriaceae bacterium]|nr:hypothetical protein [Kofleriaceae bacterium]
MAKRTITIALGPRPGEKTGETTVDDAHVFGEWAAHRNPYAIMGDHWRVTHVPSGAGILAIADDMERGDAIGLAKALNLRLPKIVVTNYLIDDETKHLIAATVGEYLGEGSVL